MYSRMIMGLGLAFLFVPINTSAYAHLPREKNNNASGLINLARNLGGSCGIAFVTTMLARWTQTHHNTLVAHLNPYNPVYQQALAGAQSALADKIADPVAREAAVQAILYGQMQRHAAMLAYLDNFRFLALLFIALIPIVFLMKKVRLGAGGMGH